WNMAPPCRGPQRSCCEMDGRCANCRSGLWPDGLANPAFCTRGACDPLHYIVRCGIVGRVKIALVQDGTAYQSRCFGFFLEGDVGRHLASFRFLGLDVLLGMGLADNSFKRRA